MSEVIFDHRVAARAHGAREQRQLVRLMRQMRCQPAPFRFEQWYPDNRRDFEDRTDRAAWIAAFDAAEQREMPARSAVSSMRRPCSSRAMRMLWPSNLIASSA